MRVLLGIISCKIRPEFSDVLRKTWIPLLPKEIDYKFFLGRDIGREPKEDEVFLNAGDDYSSLPDKVKTMVTWAYDQGYDCVIKCDDDVIIRPKEWWDSKFYMQDFTGLQEPACRPGEIRTSYGFLYTLSRRCMEIIKNAQLPGEPGSMWQKPHSNDEAFVASVLHWNGIYLSNEPRYVLHTEQRVPQGRSLRFSRAPAYTPPVNNEAFGYCVYFNGSGWHKTPESVIIAEMYKLFNEKVLQKS